MKYRNKRLGFEVVIPDGWRSPGILERLSENLNRQMLLSKAAAPWLMIAGASLRSGPEFHGPRDDSIKFAVGPISPGLSVPQHVKTIDEIATKLGFRVVEVGSIGVAGETHATMVVDNPSGAMRIKNYYLSFPLNQYIRFKGMECTVTAMLHGSEEEYDRIVQTFRPI